MSIYILLQVADLLPALPSLTQLQAAYYTQADALSRSQVMDLVWQEMPRVAGPAFTVQWMPSDNCMLHAAIYRAEPGSIKEHHQWSINALQE
nr:hypothetical protein [Herpetosiphon sp.]